MLAPVGSCIYDGEARLRIRACSVTSTVSRRVMDNTRADPAFQTPSSTLDISDQLDSEVVGTIRERRTVLGAMTGISHSVERYDLGCLDRPRREVEQPVPISGDHRALEP